MTTAPDSRRYTADDYPARLTVRDGLYCFQVPALGVIACDASVDGAHAKLRARLHELLEEARRGDLLDSLPPPTESVTGSPAAGAALRVQSDLRGFVIKTGILVAALLVILLPLSWSLGGALRSAADGLKVEGGRAFWSDLERQIVEAADPKNAIDPERQARLVGALETLASRVAPFREALAPAFGDANTACVLVRPEDLATPATTEGGR